MRALAVNNGKAGFATPARNAPEVWGRALLVNAANPAKARSVSPQAMLIAVLWILHILLSPLYVFDSGLPQPADFLMTFIALLLLLFRGFAIPRKGLPFLGLLVALAGYTAIVNGWWYLRLGSADLLVPSLYYFYICIVFSTFLALYQWLGRSFLQLTCWAFVISIGFQLLVSLQVVDTTLNKSIRASLLFKNPNQTAYHMVLAGSLLVICARARILPTFVALWMPIYLAQSIYITALTQSRAGLAGIGLLTALYSIRRFGTAIALGTMFFVAARSPLGTQLLEMVGQRLEQKRKTMDEELAYRGYARIWENPKYVLLGAGEGAYQRFEVLWGKELHSTFGNVLMSYGLVGLGLLLLFFFRVFRMGGWLAFLSYVPAFAYGLTHNGIRQSEFWMIAALLVCLKLEEAKASAAGRTIGEVSLDGATLTPVGAKLQSRSNC